MLTVQVLVTRDTHLGAMSRQQQEQLCPPQAQEPSCNLPENSDLRCQEIVQTSSTPSNLASKGEAATLAALHEFKELLSSYQVQGVVAVATAAVRDALEAGPLLQAAQTILGYPIRVLSGVEEGQLAFKGATSSLLLPITSSVRCQSCLLFDLGGRSTEFAVGNVGFEPQLVVSVPLGCLSLQAAAEDGRAGTTTGTEGPPFQLPGGILMESLQQYPWLTADRGSSLQSGCAAILAIMKLLKIHHVLTRRVRSSSVLNKPGLVPMTEKQDTKQPDVTTLEGDDMFEEFETGAADTSSLKEEDKKDLWQSDWDDENTTEDFQAKLRQELDRHMKD
eukprot:gene8161-8350_t